jgi:hypothetical protein
MFIATHGALVSEESVDSRPEGFRGSKLDAV